MVGAPRMVVTDSGAARRFKLLEQQLDERMRRCVAAAEAEVLGPRGISIVSRATGVSRHAIRRGLTELRETARRAERDGFANPAADGNARGIQTTRGDYNKKGLIAQPLARTVERLCRVP